MSKDTSKSAVIFPGQGSQEKGMGRDIAEAYPEVLELWKKAENKAAAPLREIYWEGDEEAMKQTQYQQPALVVASLGVWQLLSSSIRPEYFAGHSIGEYTALIATGVLDLQDGLELVSLRGRLMSEAGKSSSGKMAAILKLDQEMVQQIVDQKSESIREPILIANYNSPYQLVISGAPSAVDMAMDLAKQNKGRAIPLPVSGAFHSSLMQEPARELAKVMERFQWKSPTVPIHLNTTAREETDIDKLLHCMQKQMISPVYWSQLIGDQFDKGVRKWWELGPKKVLRDLVKRILQDRQDPWEVNNIGSLEEIDNFSEERAISSSRNLLRRNK